MKRRAHFVISGRVQGVCYRMYAQDEAQRLGLTGWIRNCEGGDVELVAEGEDAALRQLLEWCRHGPPHARVTGVQEAYAEAGGSFDSFEITY